MPEGVILIVLFNLLDIYLYVGCRSSWGFQSGASFDFFIDWGNLIYNFGWDYRSCLRFHMPTTFRIISTFQWVDPYYLSGTTVVVYFYPLGVSFLSGLGHRNFILIHIHWCDHCFYVFCKVSLIFSDKNLASFVFNFYLAWWVTGPSELPFIFFVRLKYWSLSYEGGGVTEIGHNGLWKSGAIWLQMKF